MGFPKIGVEAVVEGYGDFQSKLGKMGKSIAGVGKAAAKIAIGGMAVLGTATVALGAGFIKLASDAASLEGIRDAFAGIAQSAGTSQEAMLAALQKGSLGMVTQRDLMATFNEAAQLVGTTFATQLPDAFGYLSKVSAATGQDMGFMIDSLVKGVGRMSPMILDNLGIQVTLADATANAAAQFGLEADELSKTQLQTGMMNVVLEKLAENTAAMPEVAGTAAQAQAAFGVALADTKDAIGLALLPAFTKLMTAVTAFATDNLPLLVAAFEEHVVPAIETVVGWLIDEMPSAIQTASDFWTDTLQPALEDVADFILNDVIPAINDVVGFLTEKFGEAVDWVEANWPKIQDTIEDVMSTIETAVDTALGAIKDFWDTRGASILSAAETTWNSIKTLIETVINAIKGIIEAVMLAISGDWDGAWNTMKGVIDTIWAGIKTVIENTFNILKDTIIPVALDAIKNLIVTAWNILKDTVVPALWEGIKMAIKLVWYALTTIVIPTALDVIENLIETAWNFLKDTLIPGIWDAIVSVIETAWESIKEFVQDGIDTVVDIVEGVADAMYNAGAAIVENIKQGIADAWKGLTDWFSDKLSDLTDQLPFSEPRDASSPLYGLSKVGEAIIHNIAAGIRSAGGELTDALFENLEGIDELFKAGGELGGIGGVFLGRYKKETLKPAKEELDALNDQLEEQQGLFDDLADRKKEIVEKLEEEGDLNSLLLQYEIDKTALSREQQDLIAWYHQASQKQADLLVDMGLTEEERVQAAEEYAAAQERALALEQARADLKFLEAQMELLDLITEYELDPEAILGGLELGLDANLEDILDALTAAMQAIIAQAEEELQIGSESKAFAELGGQMMAGMALGIEQMASLPMRASLIATQQSIGIPALTLGASPAAGSVSTEYNEYNLGGNTINSGMDQAQFEAKVLRIVRRDAR